MCKFVAIVAVLCLSYALASAKDFRMAVKKVDGNKITGTKLPDFKKGDFKKGDGDKAAPKLEDVTLTVADGVKVTKGGKYNKETKKLEAGNAVDGGLTNAMFKPNPNKYSGSVKKIDGNNLTVVKTPFSVMCNVTTENDKVTAIRVGGGRGGFGFGGFGKGAAKGEEVTLSVTDKTKIVTNKYNKETQKVESTPLTDGLKNEAFKKENVRVTITIENSRVTEISVGGFGGKGFGGGKGGPGGGKKPADKSV